MTGTATRSFIDWAWSLTNADVPGEVRRAARRHALDGLGTALGASRLGAATYGVDVAREMGGAPEATIVDGPRVTAPVAALANGILMHALDYDDTHAESLVHATVAVVPAAIAAAEHARATGAELVTACVAGYELVTRLGAAVRHGFHAHGFHATSVCGVFSSALVGALLWKLSPAQAVSALGIAGSFAAGSLQFLQDGTPTKPVHAGWAAHSGLIAARLAAAGASGPPRILEGDSGFFRSYAGEAVAADAVVEGLGRRWETARITIKPYPACQLSHASLDALRQVRERIRDIAEIEEVEFALPTESAAIVCEPVDAKLHPRTPYDAKFSLQWCAAALLLNGRLGVGSFVASELARPEILRLAARVRHHAYASDVVAASAPGKVSVRLSGGRVERAEVATSTGAPSAPLSDDRLFEKLAGLAGDERRARAIADAVLDLDAASGVREVMTLLRTREPAVA